MQEIDHCRYQTYRIPAVFKSCDLLLVHSMYMYYNAQDPANLAVF